MTTHDQHPEYELDHHPENELAQLAVFGVAAIVLVVFAWTVGAFVP
jgi:hypothetical protein